MSNTIGNIYKLTIWGQSHAPAIGVTIEGIPAGTRIDLDKLQAFLDRRRPGKDKYSTARKESDIPEFLAGVTQPVLDLVDAERFPAAIALDDKHRILFHPLIGGKALPACYAFSPAPDTVASIGRSGINDFAVVRIAEYTSHRLRLRPSLFVSRFFEPFVLF